MGYDPFKPLMSNSMNSTPSASSPSSPGSQSTTPQVKSAPAASSSSASSVQEASSPSFNIDEEDEIFVASAVDEAFALLMSIAEADGERVDTCTSTVLKMLTNLAKNKNETKFRFFRDNIVIEV
jgi:hypothetical protein